MHLMAPQPGVAALLVSVLTAAALVAHLAYSGSDADWSLAGLRLGRRPKASASSALLQDASNPRTSNLTRLLCGGGFGATSAGGGSGGSGASASAAAATKADQAVLAALPKSWAAGHIAHDFRHWRLTGIQKEAVDKLAAAQDKYKWGEAINAFRFQIIAGQLYIDYSGMPYVTREDGQVMWFPSQTTAPGNMTASGRVPLAMLALKELLLMYPGQVPDVDAFMHFADTPWVDLADDPAAPPLFAPCSSDAYAEIPWPDWSFWSGQGWGRTREQLLQRNAATPLAGRTPALLYRGRATVDGDEKRKAMVHCGSQLPDGRKQLIDAQSVTWLQTTDRVSMVDMCNWRYLIYIEARGWSASLKYRLACGSVLLQVRPRWVEWFSRGLDPGEHYLEAPAEPLDAICPAVVGMLTTAEQAFTSGAPAPAPAGNLSSGGGGGGSGMDDDPATDPVAIATAGTAFVEHQLRMQDVREYMLDLLRTYASLQRFTPRPSPGAELLTATRLLQHFIYDEDRELVAAANPWLRCAAERGM